MDSKRLSILMEALDMGSFSRAAEVVGYTQSGLTHLVDSLERELGIRLIERGHNGISLTEDGKKLVPAIREYIRANNNLENQIKELTDKGTGTIRIAAYSSIAMKWIPEILYRFRRECPEVKVDLRMVDHALEPFELLAEGKTDVIFASRQKKADCEWVPLYNETMYAILPKDYPLGDRKSFPISEFSGHEFLMPYGKFDIEVNAAFENAGILPDERVSKVDDETVIQMVGHGLGMSMMTELMIRGRTDDVLCVPVEPHTIRELGMGTQKGVPLSASILKLKECVLRFIKEM